MNNDERDMMIMEIHTDVKVIAGRVKEHHTTLYGNGQPGLSTDVTLLQERQVECPARIATTIKAKRLNIANVLMALAIIAFLLNGVFAVLNWMG